MTTDSFRRQMIASWFLTSIAIAASSANAGTLPSAGGDDCVAEWSPLGTGFTSRMAALAVFDDGQGDGPTLYAGGLLFGSNNNLDRVARWDRVERSWDRVGQGTSGFHTALQVFDDGNGSALYAGGTRGSGGPNGGLIERWDGSQWTILIEGLQPTVPSGQGVNVMTVFDDGSGHGPALFAGGGFTETADGNTLNYIAKWDDETLVPLGTGMNGRVRALAVFDDGSGEGPALYAGGDFTMAGGVEANRIAKWNGKEWSALPGTAGDSQGLSNTVWTMEVFDDGSGDGPALYVGGIFTQAGDVEASRIAKWRGPSEGWSALGSGVDSLVSALHVFDDGMGDGPALYVGGSFTSAGGLPAHLIARWSGSSGGWSVVSTPGMNNTTRAFATFDDGLGGGPALYAGGWFTSAGGVSANRIARWGCPPTCPADLNADGEVDVLDLLRVINHWNTNNPAGDANNDGVVNVLDLLAVISSWGAVCE